MRKYPENPIDTMTDSSCSMRAAMSSVTSP